MKKSTLSMAAQFIGIAAFSFLLTVITGELNYKGVLNSVWIGFPPAITAVYFNDGKMRQVVMVVLLMLVSMTAVAVTAVTLGYY